MTAGCNVREGTTALALAAVAGHSPVVALLIDAGADLNVRSKAGYGPCADCNGCAPSESACRILGRSTALIVAAMNGHTPVVEQLIAAGAVLDVWDYAG